MALALSGSAALTWAAAPASASDWPYDRDGDGVADGIAHDGNGDGIWEWVRWTDPLGDTSVIVDLNGDQIADASALDRGSDTTIEVAFLDFNLDGSVDAAFADGNGDRILDGLSLHSGAAASFDSLFLDLNGDGTLDQGFVDLDFDGSPETMLADANQDQTLDVAFADIDADGLFEDTSMTLDLDFGTLTDLESGDGDSMVLDLDFGFDSAPDSDSDTSMVLDLGFGYGQGIAYEIPPFQPHEFPIDSLDHAALARLTDNARASAAQLWFTFEQMPLTLPNPF